MVHDNGVDWTEEHPDEGHRNRATNQGGYEPDNQFESIRDDE